MLKYCKVPTKELTQKMATISNCLNINGLRKSSNGYALVQYSGEKPKCLKGYPDININIELKKKEWLDEKE